MKTQKISPIKVTLIVASFSLLLTSAGCQDKKTSANALTGKETALASKNTKTGVKPPQIDIHTAVVTDNVDAVRQHIAAGSDINAKDPFGGSSPLITAAVFGRTEIAKALIDAKASLNFQNNDGSTALITAAFFCRPEIVKMLLEAGADKTIKNNYGSIAYETVAAPFPDVKPIYDMMTTALAPMGLKLDYAYIEKTRPQIALTLK